MNLFQWLQSPHVFDTLDAFVLRGTASILLIASLMRWLLMDGKVTLKAHRRAKEEARLDRERIAARHATHEHAKVEHAKTHRAHVN